uniref:Baeyer-Villiger monooxygenase n=1 Tax=Exophiala jeanselmei TaxID=5584 RepID=A0A8E4DIQ2_EXOJE|nr:Baeyer-Villiger monooxygenase [Exophiala jeanselmei]
MTEPTVVTTQPTLKSSSSYIRAYAREHGIELDFDPDALKAKYAEEKRKRDNPQGLGQYASVRTSKLLNSYTKDLYADESFTREPVKATYDVVIIGAGYASLMAASHLLERGITNICIIEKGRGFGGTWYWNRYPGVQCDIDSYIYMPLLEETDHIPSQKYVYGPELRHHAEQLADKFGLRPKTLFQTEVLKMTWSEEDLHWKVDTSRNDDIRAQWLLPAPGPLHLPKFPGLEGIDSFKGRHFHSCRWDYNYTGGSPEKAELTGLADKRVGIIGTGATGVQLVPRLGEWAKELYVFQRTPSSIDVRGNKPTDMEWAKTLPKGWQRARQDNFSTLVNGGAVEHDDVEDGWTDIFRSLPGFLGGGETDGDQEALLARIQIADFKKMESIRKRVDDIVKDPKTAASLKPWYNQFCKRPCFHDEYLQTFNKPNVHLVDTEGKGVERVTEKGLVANGKEYELDLIVYATGFEWATDLSSRVGAPIVGRGGQTLTDKFKDGIATFHGWSVHGFPNLTLATFHQAGATPNWTHNMNEVTNNIAHVISECKKRGIRAVEPTEEAEKAWVSECLRVAQGRASFLRDCTPGYFSDEGEIGEKLLRSQPYLAGGPAFFKIIDEWRKEDKLTGLQLST